MAQGKNEEHQAHSVTKKARQRRPGDGARSGQGGPGKTTLTAAPADIIPGKASANIDRDVCVQCTLCRELCRFHAINIEDCD